MKTIVRGRTLAVMSAAALLLVSLAPLGASEAKSMPSLRVTPGQPYVAGQAMTFTGNIGLSGERRIRIQSNMMRPGDEWNDVQGFSRMTNGDGSFTFVYPAPSMFGIHLRVATRGSATPGVEFDAQSQDLTVAALPVDGVGENAVLAGVPFTLFVDTTPVIPHRPDLPAPAIPGRTITLQQRVNGDQWKSVGATTTTDRLGEAFFTQTVPSGGPATITYRVRQENWFENGNKIGWFPSFPYTVKVVGNGSARIIPATSSTTTDLASGTTSTAREGGAIGQNGATASKVHEWGAALWDFAWEYGESLTSPPFRGVDKKGWWLDSSNGSGRVGKLNGGLALDSQRYFEGPGDYGTTRVQLRDNPATYGRWEVRLRNKRLETGHADYHSLIELVPERAADYRCGTQNITVADVKVEGSTLTYGVKARSGKKWTATKRLVMGDQADAFAVEVTKDHISWFVNGQVIGTVNNSAAVSDVPMTLRLSQVGDGGREMNHTQMFSDWERGWDLSRGKKVTNGDALRAGTYDASCKG